MANPEHLQILKQGIAAWNAWREQNRDIRPDLSGATLTRAHLSGANLSAADLSGSTLTGAILARATLTRTTLTGAELTGTNLTEANFTGADLSRARLFFVRLHETVFSDTNLTAVGGLETCRHLAPSTIAPSHALSPYPLSF
jgi:uncharacterized protein YjbI with pentapeptide repeats